MKLARPPLFPPILLVATLLFWTVVLVIYIHDEQGDTSCGGG